MTWSNGRHAYYGPQNGRGQRSASKILKGLKISKKETRQAFEELEKEKQNDCRPGKSEMPELERAQPKSALDSQGK